LRDRVAGLTRLDRIASPVNGRRNGKIRLGPVILWSLSRPEYPGFFIDQIRSFAVSLTDQTTRRAVQSAEILAETRQKGLAFSTFCGKFQSRRRQS